MEAHTYDDRSFLMQSFLSHRRFVVIFLFDRVEERRGEEKRGVKPSPPINSQTMMMIIMTTTYLCLP